MFNKRKALCIALVACLAAASGTAAPPQRPAAAVGDPTVPQRFIVHFAQRSFDLSELRAAILAKRPAADIVARLDQRVRDERRGFVADVESLGGKVNAQWWIIDACAVELPTHGAVDQVRALPGVARLEPDSVVTSADRGQSKYNHNTDALHAALLTGAGVTIAVVDGGHDSDIGTGRPHRTYFPGGDPNNTTGAGLAGSRLLWNKPFGLLPADGAACHGIAVDAIAAGGSWGTPGASAGNAFGADLAGYAIADQRLGCNFGAKASNVVSAWQQVLADRGTLPAVNIAVGNFSVSGWADPLNALSMAIDSAAVTGDILIAVAAGNTGDRSIFSNGATNGIAAAAVRPDSHDLVRYSSRGPILARRQRGFPDLSAAIHTFVPLENCESGDQVFSGTSNAAPQIAGVAALLRAAVPALSAVETKAVLLAASRDIAAANPALGRNDYGVGMLRADTALAAARIGLFGTAALTTAAPSRTLPIQVQAGETYGVAIAWHRQNVGSDLWSDLDLRILDGASVVAASATPDDLYETVRFVAPRTGALALEVKAGFLEAGSQSFAWAVAPGVGGAPRAGRFTAFGSGCPGSTGTGGTLCGGVNAFATPQQLDVFELGGNVEMAWSFTPTSGTPLTGIELLVGSDVGGPMRVALHTDAGGVPAATPIATGTMTLGTQPAWHRAVFAQPVPVTAWQPIWVAFGRAASDHRAFALAAGVGGTLAMRDGCGGAWEAQGIVALGVRLLCGGGASGPSPLIGNAGVPQVGGTFQIRLDRAAAASNAFLLLGVSNALIGGLPLPLSLAGLGAPGCAVLVSNEGIVGTTTGASGSASIPVTVPGNPALVGARFYGQFLVLDPPANALGVVTSPGAEARTGS